MKTLCVHGVRLTVAVCVLLVGSIARAGHSPHSRVHAFAALPDWSGLWVSEVWPVGVSGRVPGGEAQLRQTLQLIRPPPYNPAWKARYEEGMKDSAALAALNATFKGCTRSFPGLMEAPWMFQVAVLPEETLLVFENQQVRHIYTDGREHPGEDELWPTSLGDSIGHWKGDTLVVDTVARKHEEPLAPRAWLSLLSDRAHFTEEIRMVAHDRLEDDLTIDDPVALAYPWHIKLTYRRVSELNRMVETNCTENDRNAVVDGKLTITPP
jgi:hypothetical protein